MRRETPVRMDVAALRERVVAARRRATTAITTQERLHLEGMASYWEDLLDEEANADPTSRTTQFA